jgi:holliday junction DNA helicase RuvA
MIEHVRGELVHKSPTHVVVEANGVGYGLAISLTTYDQLPSVGETGMLLTHLYVREDRMELFGFADQRERTMFQILLGVSGIGPNSAQAVLSGIAISDLEDAIYHGRANELTAIKGIGRKTAERMILDLRDKVQPHGHADAAVDPEAPSRHAHGQVGEAEMALVALGIAPAAARQAIAKVQKKSDVNLSLQELIKLALRQH